MTVVDGVKNLWAGVHTPRLKLVTDNDPYGTCAQQKSVDTARVAQGVVSVLRGTFIFCAGVKQFSRVGEQLLDSDDQVD